MGIKPRQPIHPNDRMRNADLIILLTRNDEGKRVVEIDKNRYTGQMGYQDDLDPVEFEMLIRLYFGLKDDKRYKKIYDKLKFAYNMSEAHF